MDFLGGKDEDFFESLQRSRNNLDDLFGVGESHLANPKTDNPTLKYQPPKQGPAKAIVQPSQTQSSTVLVKIATAYKNNEALGKVGVALVKSDIAMKIIAYKSKTNVLATLTLHNDKNECSIYQQNGYMQFYDDAKSFWSFRYDSAKDEEEFIRTLREVGIQVQSSTVKEAVKVPNVATNDIPQKQPDEPPVEEVSAKVEEQSIPKESLISRMAKIGTPVSVVAHQQKLQQLKTTTTTTDYSDSSDTEVIKPVIVPRQKSQQQHQQLKTQLVPTTSAVYSVSQPMEAQLAQMMLTENRTQNTELRMNISKLDSKMDTLLDRFDTMRSQHGRQNHDDEILELEEKILELKKENRKLKQSIEGKGASQRNDELKWRKFIDSLRDELEELGVSRSDDVESQIEEIVGTSLKMQQDLKKKAAELKLLQSGREEDRKRDEEFKTEMEARLTSLKTALNDKEKLLKENEEKLILANKRKMDTEAALEDQVKSAMTDLYNNLLVELRELPEMRGVEKLLATTIRKEVLKTCASLTNKLKPSGGGLNDDVIPQ